MLGDKVPMFTALFIGNLAAESQARKASEAKRLAKENAQLSERIANTHAKTDDGDGLQF